MLPIALRVSVGLAVAASLACGLVALMVSRGGMLLLEQRMAFSRWKPAEQNLLRVAYGYAAGMVLGLSRVVWRKAVIADTWALSILLFATMLALLMRLGQMGRTAKNWLLGLIAVFVGTGPLMVALLNPPKDLASLQTQRLISS